MEQYQSKKHSEYGAEGFSSLKYPLKEEECAGSSYYVERREKFQNIPGILPSGDREKKEPEEGPKENEQSSFFFPPSKKVKEPKGKEKQKGKGNLNPKEKGVEIPGNSEKCIDRFRVIELSHHKISMMDDPLMKKVTLDIAQGRWVDDKRIGDQKKNTGDKENRKPSSSFDQPASPAIEDIVVEKGDPDIGNEVFGGIGESKIGTGTMVLRGGKRTSPPLKKEITGKCEEEDDKCILLSYPVEGDRRYSHRKEVCRDGADQGAEELLSKEIDGNNGEGSKKGGRSPHQKLRGKHISTEKEVHLLPRLQRSIYSRF